MSATGPSRTSVMLKARAVLLIFGLAMTSVALVKLIDAKLALAHVAPWSYLGLLGLVAVLVALGSPWSGRIRND
jgi:hypothetical protein